MCWPFRQVLKISRMFYLFTFSLSISGMTSLLAKQWIPSQTIFDLIHCESQWIKPKIVLKVCLTLTAIQMLLIFFVILRNDASASFL